MSDKRASVEIKIFDEETGVVELHVIEEYGGGYGYEVTRMFTKLGERFAPILDPHYRADE